MAKIYTPRKEKVKDFLLGIVLGFFCYILFFLISPFTWTWPACLPVPASHYFKFFGLPSFFYLIVLGIFFRQRFVFWGMLTLIISVILYAIYVIYLHNPQYICISRIIEIQSVLRALQHRKEIDGEYPDNLNRLTRVSVSTLSETMYCKNKEKDIFRLGIRVDPECEFLKRDADRAVGCKNEFDFTDPVYDITSE